MKKIIGKVVEVFIPEQYKNGNLLDVMDRDIIGFKIATDEGIKTYTMEQNAFNVYIKKNNLVLITEQVIDKQLFVDIECGLNE